MSNYRFSMAPNISVPRSRFKMPFNHATSFNHGKLIPIDCFEVLPGDQFKLNLSAIIRMSTPIAPIFGNIKAYVHAFFVPMRLLWSHTKEFYGEDRTNAGYQATGTYYIPAWSYSSGSGHFATLGSVSHYLGKPLKTSVWDSGTTQQMVSVLKERGYYMIWSEYYRAQQLQNPALVAVGDCTQYSTGSDVIGNISDGNDDISGSTNLDFSGTPMNVCKEFDYFTASTLAPQAGSGVTLPLGTSAPVGFIASTNATQTGNPGGPGIDVGTSFVANQFSQYKTLSTTSNNGLNVIADLSNATAASINSIRYAFQVQKWLERANFGSRFFEMLNLHYGVTSPDARLQRPEYLGGKSFYINVDQVISTAGYSASPSTTVGEPGALSVSGLKGSALFTKAFVEPGYVYVLICTKHERSYAQGILREDSRSDRFDFYFPEFANLGDQAVYNKEICYTNLTADDDDVFGYQEHWAEYRYRPDRVSGLMDPNATGALSFWTLAEKFGSLPTLSNSFIMETRDDLVRALKTGATGPDYIADFYFDYTAMREMPLYTIPGLVDHFGTM